MERSLHEIFTDVAEESSINKKVEILKDNDSQGLQVFLRCVFDDKIAWLIPDSKPPYEPNDAPEWDLADMKLERALSMLSVRLTVTPLSPSGCCSALCTSRAGATRRSHPRPAAARASSE